MIHKRGYVIAGIVGIVLAAALGYAPMHDVSAETWAGVILLTTCGILMFSVIGAVCGSPVDRPRRLGFAMFGWGYFLLAHWYSYHQGPMPTVHFVPGSGEVHGDLRDLTPIVRIAHDAWALVFAVLGARLTARFFEGPVPNEPQFVEEARPDGTVAGWWRKPALVGLLGFGLVVAATLAGWWWDPEIGTGTAFLLTWALAGLAILGAMFTRGRRRQAWLGAASFGLGYLLLAFSFLGSPQLPTNHLLNAVCRPGDPMAADDLLDADLLADDESQRVKQALDERISLHFGDDTPLKVVLAEIGGAIRKTWGKDPLRSATGVRYLGGYVRFDELVVKIDRENIPAKEALRLCLGPLGLTYRIQSGDIRIDADASQAPAFQDDPVMIAGHSLIALIVAAIGGAVAPTVADLCRRHGPDAGRETA